MAPGGPKEKGGVGKRRVVPLDPVRDRAWMKSNGLGVVAGEEVFQQAVAEYVQKAKEQSISKRRFKFRPSEGLLAVQRQQWKVCLHGKWSEVAVLALDYRQGQETQSAQGPANARRNQMPGLDFNLSLRPETPKKARSNAVRQTPGYQAYVDYVGTSPDLNAKEAHGPAGQRRMKRASPPQPYVTADVFDTLEELVKATRLAAATAYVKTKDYLGAKAALDQAKQGVGPQDMYHEMGVIKAAIAENRRDIRDGNQQTSVRRRSAMDGVREFARQWRVFVTALKAKSSSTTVTARISHLTQRLGCPIGASGGKTSSDTVQDMTADGGAKGTVVGSGLGDGSGGGFPPKDGMSVSLDGAGSNMVATSSLATDMGGAITRAAASATTTSFASQSLATDPPSALVDTATNVTRRKIWMSRRRRYRTWDVTYPGVSILTGERLKPSKKKGKLREWMTKTIRKQRATLRDHGVVRGTMMVVGGGLSTDARKIVRDFYMKEQRITDQVVREGSTLGLSTGTSELADFSAQDFAEAASNGNFEYLSVMLTYRQRHDLVAKYVPIDSRTSSGYTAFHAAFLQVLEAEQAAAQEREMMKAEHQQEQPQQQQQQQPGPVEQREEKERDEAEQEPTSKADGGATTFDRTVNFMKTVFFEKQLSSSTRTDKALDMVTPPAASKKNDEETKEELVSFQKCRVLKNMADYDRVITLLLHHGAKINCFPIGKPLMDCLAPLHEATRMGNHYRMDYLLKRGAGVNLPTTLRKYTALMIAARGGKSETLAILMAHKADLDKADAQGWTALHHAASAGHMHAVRTLIIAGANRQAVNNGGLTAAQEAKNNEQVDAFTTIMSFNTGAYRPGRLLDHLAMVHEAKTGEKLVRAGDHTGHVELRTKTRRPLARTTAVSKSGDILAASSPLRKKYSTSDEERTKTGSEDGSVIRESSVSRLDMATVTTRRSRSNVGT